MNITALVADQMRAREHDYSHCKTHGPRGGLSWCSKCPECLRHLPGPAGRKDGES